MPEIVAIDLGTKKIGVARCNAHVAIPEPLEMLKVDGTEYQKLAELMEQNNAGTLVVGMPRGGDGQLTQESKRAKRVIKQLMDRPEFATIKIVIQDESLTSVEAQEILDHNQLEKPAASDSVAACIILKDYLEDLRRNEF